MKAQIRFLLFVAAVVLFVAAATASFQWVHDLHWNVFGLLSLGLASQAAGLAIQ